MDSIGDAACRITELQNFRSTFGPATPDRALTRSWNPANNLSSHSRRKPRESSQITNSEHTTKSEPNLPSLPTVKPTRPCYGVPPKWRPRSAGAERRTARGHTEVHGRVVHHLAGGVPPPSLHRSALRKRRACWRAALCCRPRIHAPKSVLQQREREKRRSTRPNQAT